MVASGWCRECSSAEAMSAETQAQEGELSGGLSLVLLSCALTSIPSVSCLRLWSIFGVAAVGVPAANKLAQYRITSCCQSKTCTLLFFPIRVTSCLSLL